MGTLRRRRRPRRACFALRSGRRDPGGRRYLRAAGAPADSPAAIFAHDRADWYVAEVLAKADQYRGAPATSDSGDGPQVDSGAAREVLADPRITVTPIQRSDLRSGLIDPRVIATLAWIGRHHSVVITALRSDHSEFTVDGTASSHSAGRAMDIGAVDGEVCRGTRTGRCADLVREPAAVHGELRSTKLI